MYIDLSILGPLTYGAVLRCGSSFRQGLQPALLWSLALCRPRAARPHPDTRALQAYNPFPAMIHTFQCIRSLMYWVCSWGLGVAQHLKLRGSKYPTMEVLSPNTVPRISVDVWVVGPPGKDKVYIQRHSHDLDRSFEIAPFCKQGTILRFYHKTLSQSLATLGRSSLLFLGHLAFQRFLTDKA